MNRFFVGWLRDRGLAPRGLCGLSNDPAGPEWSRLALP